MKFLNTLITIVIINILTAQKLELVKDINPTGDSYSHSFYNFNNKMFFVAEDGIHGSELWSTDGTENGTKMIKDIYASSTYSAYILDFNIMNNKLYFTTSDGTHGYELWATDGTENGTSMVKDVRTISNGDGIDFSYPLASRKSIVTFDNSIFFSGNGQTNGFNFELWHSDGTESGTQLFKELNNSSGVYKSSHPEHFFVYDNKLLFNAYDTINGSELWVSDGTPNGTKIVKNINPTSHSNVRLFYEYNNKVYFQAKNSNGLELWVTDGTNTGTNQLIEINPSGNADPTDFIEFGNKLYFNANDGVNGMELWVTDGTVGGTQILKDINPSGSSQFNNFFRFSKQKIVFNNRLFFTASNSNNLELYSTDGTLSGTNLHIDINGPSLSSNPKNLIVFDDKLYFTARNDSNSIALFSLSKTDELKEINPINSTSINPLENSTLHVYGNSLYFTAKFDQNGIELWRLTNDTIDTTPIKEILSDNDFVIYPIPVTDILQYKCKHKIKSISIQNIEGQSFIIKQFPHNRINTSKLSKGVYYLIIETNLNTIKKKFIKQ